MPYYIGYKPSRQTSNIYIESYESLDEATDTYAHLKKSEYPGEIILSPFFADTEEEAREKAKESFPA